MQRVNQDPKRCKSIFHLLLIILWFAICGNIALADPWPEKKYNPNPLEEDFILPLPGEGHLVFRPVYVVQSNAATASRFIMGNENYAPVEYPQEASISGAFHNNKGYWLYYLSKYEITEAQYQTVIDGKAPQRISKMPQTRVSWFDANRFCEKLTTWLMQNHKNALPAEDNASGYIRLPTEEEWEYACRGGMKVDANFFARENFISDEDDIADYVQYYRVGDVESVQPIGLTSKPNPIGLFDMLGNAGEMCLDIFQLNNNVGRFGGFAARGGTIRLSEQRIRSSYRQECPFYDQRKNVPFDSGTIGFRVVLTAPVFTSRQRKQQIDDEWQQVSLPQGGDLKLTFDQAYKKLARISTRVTDATLKNELDSIKNSYTDIARELNNVERKDSESYFRIGTHIAGTIHLQLKKMAVLAKFLEDLKADPDTNPAFITKTEANLGKIKQSVAQNLNSYGHTIENISDKYKQFPKIVNEAYEAVVQQYNLDQAQSQIVTLEQMYLHVKDFRQRVPNKWQQDITGL